MNRFIWDARHPVAERLRTNKTAFEAERGPLALPGGYQVELTVNGETLSERFELVKIDRELEVLHQLLATGLGTIQPDHIRDAGLPAVHIQAH